MNTRILGLSAYYHDSAACLLVDGEVVAAAQEERFSRRKHDAGFPAAAVDACLRAGGIGAADELDHVVFYDKPILKFQRLLESYLQFAPVGLESFLQAMPVWLGGKLKIRDLIRSRLGYAGSILFTEHHQSHAASAFYPSPFDRAAILTIDGVGERTTASVGIGEGREVRILRELHFPHSLGLLYSAFTYFTGFRVNSGEYKLMGLAPYGQPRYVDLILDELVDLREDGSLGLNMRYFDYGAGLRMTNQRFAGLFGGPRRAGEATITEREMDLAASIQRVTEEAMLRMARFAHRLTGVDKLVLAGGVALNCVGNGRILREGPFDDLWIQPAAGDAGGALGAALYVHHQLLGNERAVTQGRDSQKTSLLGPEFGDDEIEDFLSRRGIAATRIDDDEQLTDRVAALLAEGSVVGWFQGRMEFGPRALGNRSILADPRDAGMRDRINRKVKFRESFRPFAPAVLEEHLGTWFELDRPSPYMLLVCALQPAQRLPVDEEGEGLEKLAVVRSTLPAITHVNGSARVQTVSREGNPRFHALIRSFYQETGCPVLLNTSFNLRGEPIVCTPEEAYNCFQRSGIDVLVLGRHLIEPAAGGAPREAIWESTDDADDATAGAAERRDARRFGAVLASVFLIVASIWHLLDSPGRARLMAAAAVVVALCAAWGPRPWVLFFRLWTKVAAAVASVISKVALGAFYYLVLTPAGLFRRLIGKPSLDTKWKDGRSTFWSEKPELSQTVERYRRQF